MKYERGLEPLSLVDGGRRSPFYLSHTNYTKYRQDLGEVQFNGR